MKRKNLTEKEVRNKRAFFFTISAGKRNTNGYAQWTTVNIYELVNNSPVWFMQERFRSGGLTLIHAISDSIIAEHEGEEFLLFDLEEIAAA